MKKRSNHLRTILLIVALIVVLIQFFPVNRDAPPVDPTQDFIAQYTPLAGVAQLMRDACYDCHSYETEYPWYAYIAPVSFWMQNHINSGRQRINFSIWSTSTSEDIDHALKDMIDAVSEKRMPLNSYLRGHPEARLTDAQRAEMTTWFQTLKENLRNRDAIPQQHDEVREDDEAEG